LRISVHKIQGVNIHLNCDHRIQPLIANYFNFFYDGNTRPEIKPIEYELTMVKDPPAVPVNAVKALTSPEITSYKNCKDIYYISKDGSITHLNSVTRKIMGFLKQEVLNNLPGLYDIVGAPFSEIFKYHTLYSLHTAALYCNDVGYLISGESGSGKTTTTLNLVSHGFKYVSDDMVLLEEINGEIIAHSLANTFNIDRDLARRNPGFVKKEKVPARKGSKVLVDITQIIPDSFIPFVRPNAIIFLKITSNGHSHICPLNQMETYNRMLQQSALALDREASRNQLNVLGRLVRQVRGFELFSGRDVYDNPGMIKDIICKASGQNGNN
jgi:hypothetical protein